jgi:hypothetical protein
MLSEAIRNAVGKWPNHLRDLLEQFGHQIASELVFLEAEASMLERHGCLDVEDQDPIG